MRIDTLTIENFKSIEHLQIDFGGNNATISGQNGTGKTTVLDAVCWLLSGKFHDGKAGESSNLHDKDKVTTVTLTFTHGLKLRRECNGRSVYYINGVPCNATNYTYDTAEIFKAALPILLTPFNFCAMHYRDRRGILLKLFAPKLEIDMAEFTDIAEGLKTLTAEQIIKMKTAEKKKLQKETDSIPARIEELQKNIVEIDIDELQTEIESLTEKIAAKLEEINKLQAALNANSESTEKARELFWQADEAEKKLEDLRAEYRSNEIERERLLKEYYNVKEAASGTCPTCGSKLPASKSEQLKSKLQEIVATGKSIAEKQELLKKDAEVAKSKADDLRQQAAELQRQCSTDSTFGAKFLNAVRERDLLQEKLSQAKATFATVQKSFEMQDRIEKLKKFEFEIGDLVNACDKKIFLAEKYIRRTIETLEQSINDHFQFVQFRMFEAFKVAEGVKEICEPYLNGVPYAALSKGEKLKASLDILQALQGAYGIELPVFIDDAESYTRNSFVNLPNQVILLKATEGVKELQIDIDAANEERKSA